MVQAAAVNLVGGAEVTRGHQSHGVMLVVLGLRVAWLCILQRV